MAAIHRSPVKLRRVLIYIIGLIGASILRAHDPGISIANGELKVDTFVLATGFAPADAQHFLPRGQQRGGTWTEEEFTAVKDQLQANAPRLWEVRTGERTLSPRD